MLGSFSSGNIGFGVLLSAQDAFSANFQKFRNELRLTSAASTDFSNKLSKTASSLAVFSGLSVGIVGLGIAINEIATLAGEYEQLEIAIKAMSGSAAIGHKLLGDLRVFSLESPLNFKDTVEQTKRLMAYGLEVKDVMRDMRMLTEISAGVGLDKFPFLALAYGQTLGGTITGQEINQFANAGVGIYKELDKIRGWKPGTARSQTAKALTPEVIREVLMSLVNEGGRFHKLMEKQLDSWAGQVNRMKESIYFLKVDIGKVVSSRYINGLKRLNKLTGGINEFMQSNRGNATIQSFLKLFEAIGATVLLVTLGLIVKTMFLLTGFLLPTAIKETFMLALANNQLGRATSILFASFVRGAGVLFHTVFVLGQIAFFAFVAHQALKKMFGTNYISDFWNILSGTFELIQNYNPATGKSLLSDETLNVLSGIKGGLPLAVKLFVIFADIRRIVVGIGQGILWVLEKFYSVLAVVGNIFLKIAKIFGFFKESDEVVGGGFMNDSAALNIGRLIGFIIGLKIVYKLAKGIYNTLVFIAQIRKVPAFLKGKFSAFADNVKNGVLYLRTIGFMLNDKLKPVKKWFRDMWLTARVEGSMAWDKLKSIGDKIKVKFKNVTQSIKKGFKDAFSYINTVLKSFLNGLKNGFSKIGNYLKDPLKNRVKPVIPEFEYTRRQKKEWNNKNRKHGKADDLLFGFNFSMPKLSLAFPKLAKAADKLKLSLKNAFSVIGNSKVAKGLKNVGSSIGGMLTNMKSKLPSIGTMFNTIGGKMRNLSRGIKGMISSMRLATIASRVWSFVTGRGLQVVGKGLKMITSKLFLTISALLILLGLFIAIKDKFKKGEGGSIFDPYNTWGANSDLFSGKIGFKEWWEAAKSNDKYVSPTATDSYNISPPGSRTDITPVTKSKDGKSYEEWRHTGTPKKYTEKEINTVPIIIKLEERVLGEVLWNFMNKSDEKK
jgi:hypothetical protein